MDSSEQPELRMAKAATLLGAGLAVPAVGFGWLAAGPSGAFGAGLGVGLVVVLFAMSGVLLTWAAPMGPTAIMTAALGGVLFRFLLYGLLLVLLSPTEAVHGPSLAIATAVAMIVTLAYEVRLVGKTPSFWWVRTPPPTRSAAGADPAVDERSGT